jgi:hypothetical protein
MKIYVDTILLDRSLTLLSKFESENKLRNQMIVFGASTDFRNLFLGFYSLEKLGIEDVVFSAGDNRYIHLYRIIIDRNFKYFSFVNDLDILNTSEAMSGTDYALIERAGEFRTQS